jgi:hypothetical protein
MADTYVSIIHHSLFAYSMGIFYSLLVYWSCAGKKVAFRYRANELLLEHEAADLGRVPASICERYEARKAEKEAHTLRPS